MFRAIVRLQKIIDLKRWAFKMAEYKTQQPSPAQRSQNSDNDICKIQVIYTALYAATCHQGGFAAEVVRRKCCIAEQGQSYVSIADVAEVILRWKVQPLRPMCDNDVAVAISLFLVVNNLF